MIRKQDSLSETASHTLHFKNDKEQKTIFGGVISLIIYAYIVKVVFVQGFNMITRSKPFTQSYQTSYESDDKVYINQTDIELQHYIIDTQWNRFPIDKRYIKIYIEEITQTR